MSSPITLTYSQVDGLDIQVDIWYPTDPQFTGPRPGVVFFHGGALVTGSRDDQIMIPQPVLQEIVRRGFFVIAPDYRLLHPSTGHDQLADVRALFAFLRSPSLPAILAPLLPSNSGISLDVTSFGLIGSSAGGYLARFAALYCGPFRAFLSLFGMGGDFLHSHWIDTHDKPMTLLSLQGIIPRETVAHLLDDPGLRPSASAPSVMTKVGVVDRDKRGALFPWWYQRGDYLDFVTGISGLGAQLRALPYEARAHVIPEAAKAALPQFALNDPSIAALFPPTALAHGTADSLVPVAESELTYKQLKAAGVEVELMLMPGGEHGFLSGSEGLQTVLPEGEALYTQATEFVLSRLNQTSGRS